MSATIVLRETSSTIPELMQCESEVPAQYQYIEKGDVRTELPPALRFEREINCFQFALGQERDAARSAIVKKIITANKPDEYIQTALHTFISSSRPGRLDDAIDILSQCGQILPHFVYEVRPRHQPEPINEDYWIDEDYWYVLIRSIGKSSLAPAEASSLVTSLWSHSPEAVLEALGDIGDEGSLKQLRDFATKGESDFIQRLAQEILEECQE